jgi:hypothetical protein
MRNGKRDGRGRLTPRLTDSERAAIIRDYRRNEPVVEIARRHGVTAGYVSILGGGSRRGTSGQDHDNYVVGQHLRRANQKALAALSFGG